MSHTLVGKDQGYETCGYKWQLLEPCQPLVLA